MRVIGIMGAMPEEVNDIITLLDNPHSATIGMRTYTSGLLNGMQVVVVFSRWGKVAAASTVTTLINVYEITELIFTGVAGAIDPALKIGDIIVAKRLIQHDMDARPLMPQFEIPLLEKTWFECNKELVDHAENAISQLLEKQHLNSIVGREALQEFGIHAPSLHMGDIASGDQFFANDPQKEELQKNLPGILCVEMEGAAVAQVCYEHGIPFVIIRTISDAANEESHVDFPAFINKVASKYSECIMRHIYDHH